MVRKKIKCVTNIARLIKEKDRVVFTIKRSRTENKDKLRP